MPKHVWMLAYGGIPAKPQSVCNATQAATAQHSVCPTVAHTIMHLNTTLAAHQARSIEVPICSVFVATVSCVRSEGAPAQPQEA